MKTKIGYFVPEFPGQTHMFFWREVNALKEYDIEPDFVSSRLPPSKIISHVWSREAQQKTTYLFPPTHYLVGALTELLRSGPLGWLSCLKAALTAKGVPFSTKIRLLALAFPGSQLAYLARTRGWRHVHVHSCADSANIAMFAKLISGLPYSLTLHGSLEDYGPNQEQKWQAAQFAIVITKKLYEEVHQQLAGYLPSVVRIAPMGVDCNIFKRKTDYVPWDGTQPCRVFSCGRLNRCKGHADLISAVVLLKKKGLQVELKIAGEDELGGSGYHKELEKLIQQFDLEDSVHLLGAVSEEEVREALEQVHIFALASWHEPLGVAIMEAMAMAVPVVVSKGGGVEELVDNGVDGLLVAPKHPEAIAHAIEKILYNRQLALHMSGYSRRKIVEEFHHYKSAEVFAECLE